MSKGRGGKGRGGRGGAKAAGAGRGKKGKGLEAVEEEIVLDYDETENNLTLDQNPNSKRRKLNPEKNGS